MSSDPLMELANVDTAALLPSSISSDANLSAVAGALDLLWQTIGPVVPTLGVLATIAEQPEDVVDRLAYQFHVDYYDETWDITKKRAAVINSIRLHRLAGTRGAVEDVLRDVWGNGATVMEWWEFGGEPGTFDVIITDPLLEPLVLQMTASLRKVKRATDHLTISTLNDVGTATIYAGAVYHQYDHYRL